MYNQEKSPGSPYQLLFVLLALVLLLSFSIIPSEEKRVEMEEKRMAQQAMLIHDQLTGGKVSTTSEAAENLQASVSEEKAADQAESAVKTKTAAVTKVADARDIIPMDNPAFERHRKGIVQFTHAVHTEKYAKECGDCHHDDKGNPINDLKPEDTVQGCIACHTETKMERGEKLSDKEKIMKYYEEALHSNCIECHKTFNIENGDPKGKQPAPASCAKCHPKS